MSLARELAAFDPLEGDAPAGGRRVASRRDSGNRRSNDAAVEVSTARRNGTDFGALPRQVFRFQRPPFLREDHRATRRDAQLTIRKMLRIYPPPSVSSTRYP